MNEWKPTPKQTEALKRTEFEILFGGSRGGGKTAAGMAWLLYDIDKSDYRALVIRRNADDLKDWTDRAFRMWQVCKVEKVNNPPEFRFPSGAIIRTGHLKDENAYTKYQGHQYQKMLIEELTQIDTEKNYEMLLQSCRSDNPAIKPQVFCTTNPAPGEPGHKWVMKRFINVAKPGEAYIDPVSGITRIFIPAGIEDNPHLLETDPLYIKRLEGIQDERLRNAWRYGVWEDVDVEGAYYARLMRDVVNTGRVGNIPYEPNLLVDTAWDLGFDDSMSIGFFQTYRREIRCIDYIEVNNTSMAECIRMLKEKNYTYGYHYAPHDINVHELTSGRSRIEIANNLGIKFTVVTKHNVEDGIEAVRTLLPRIHFDQNKTKDLQEALFNYRQKWNEQLQIFQGPLHDKFSHAADMMRYYCYAYKEKAYQDSQKYAVDTVPISAITNW